MLTAHWQKSDVSGGGDCAEVRLAAFGAAVEVRNSKAPDAGTVVFTRAEWTAFLGGVRRHQFDLPD